MTASPLILHIPHASTFIPAEWRGKILLDDAALEREIIAMTDMHTDELYDVPGADRAVMPVSRLLVDAERFPDDALESMAKIGMGAVYTRTSDLKPLREAPGEEERMRLLDAYYFPHHRKLNALAARHLAARGFCLVVDCHSFPSRALPYEGRPAGEKRAPICIGTDAFHTPEWAAEALMDAFRSRGHEVARDTPFAGALTPGDYYGRDRNVLSVMIEVRRDLYMDEATGGKNARFGDIKRDIRAAIGALSLACRERMPYSPRPEESP